MAILYYSTLFFACWTVAYHITLVGRAPAFYLYFIFLLLLIPSFTLFRKLHKQGRAAPGAEKSGWVVYFGVLSVSAVTALSSMIVSIPNVDDLGFLHRAFVQYNHLADPIYNEDTLHNMRGMPYTISQVPQVSLVTSYEILSVFAAKVLGLNPVLFYHNITCAAASFLVPLVYFRLYKEQGFEDLKSFVAMTGAVVFLWFDGNLHRSFGNYAFIRMFQGKAVFMTLLIPLFFLYMEKYYKNPGWKNWLMLFLAGICSAGLTTNGLFMTPALLLVYSTARLIQSSLAHPKEWKVALRPFFILNLAGAYCVTISLLISPTSSHVFSEALVKSRWWSSIFTTVLGFGWSDAWYGLLLLVVPWFALEKARSRFWAFYILSFILICYNPVTGPIWINLVIIYWRFAFLLPLPFCAGLGVVLLISVFTRKGNINYRSARTALTAALVLCAVLAFDKTTFSIKNDAHYQGLFDYKFRPAGLNFSKAISKEVSGRNMLAPGEIAVVLPLISDSVQMEATRVIYTVNMFSLVGDESEGLRRMRAQAFVESGPKEPGDSAAFDTSIQKGVNAVVTRTNQLPLILNVLSRLPGSWKLTYRDNNFALILKDR